MAGEGACYVVTLGESAHLSSRQAKMRIASP